jgi:outer membrane protein TolC
MKSSSIILAAFVLLFSASGFARGREITLKECVVIALQNNPDLEVADENWKKALADYRIARASKGIQISGVIYTQEFNRDNLADSSVAGKDTDIGLVFGINATYSLFNYRLIKQEQAARSSLDLVKIEQMRTRSTIILDVKRSYYAFLMAGEIMTLREKLYISNKEKLQLAQKLFRSGQRPVLDVTKAEIDYAQAILDYEKAKNIYRTARIQLYMAIGVKDMGADIVPVEMAALVKLKYTVPELMKLAKTYNYDLQNISTAKKVNKLRIEQERALRYPDINLNLAFGYQNRAVYQNDSFKGFIDENNWEVKVAPQLRINIPIYSSGAVSARVDGAISNFNKVVYQEKQVLLNLENQILNDVQTLDEIQKQIDMSVLIIENARKLLQLASKSYEAGSNSLMDLQDAQMRVITSEIGYINSKYLYLRTISQLANKIGLEEEFLCKESD